MEAMKADEARDMKIRTDDLIEWAKNRRASDVLAHSYVTHPLILEALEDAYDSPLLGSLFGEDDQWGLPSLRLAISQRYGIQDYPGKERLLLTSSATSAIYLTCIALSAPGDEVIVEAPFYEPIVRAAARPGVNVELWPRKLEDFSLNLDGLPERINEKTRLIFLTNIHNPTSTLTGDAEFVKLAETVSDAQPDGRVKIVVDEIYRGFVAEEEPDSSSPTVATLGDIFVSINSLSKVYGLSRLKCGWIFAAPDVIDRLRQAFKVVLGIGSLDLEALAAILFGRIKELTEVARYAVNRNRVILQEELKDLIDDGVLEGEIPDYGSVYFPKLPWLEGLGQEKALELVEKISGETGVVPGRFFGPYWKAHIRIGFGQPEDLFVPAINDLAEYLERQYEANV
jgi:aspartate/methionine/tyrosine aminotransferase